MKYYVVANRWSCEEDETIKYVVGEFRRLVDAALFLRAYEAEYDTKVEILDVFAIFNLRKQKGSGKDESDRVCGAVE